LQRKAWAVFNAKAQPKVEFQFYPVEMLHRMGTAFSQHDKEFVSVLGNEFGWLAVTKALWYLWREEQEIKNFGEKLRSFFNK